MKRLEIHWVRDSAVAAPAVGHRITCADDVARIASNITRDEAVETCLVFLLDARHRVQGYHVVARGTLNAAIVHPRDVFKAAFLANAESVILAHNHPSSDATPSTADDTLTAALRNAGTVLGIELLDHVVVTDEPERHYSYAGDGWRRITAASRPA